VIWTDDLPVLLRIEGEFSGIVLILLGGRLSLRRDALLKGRLSMRCTRRRPGRRLAEVIRKIGISDQTYYRWKKQYAGMEVAELRRFGQLEEENRKL
jgi:putative transposase